jgi:ferrochelatase
VTIGVVVMAYGTPASLDEVEGYYTHIRRGRAPEPALLAELVARYQSIGGTSPLRAITLAQTARIATALGDGFVVAHGAKHAAPFIEDAVAEVAAAGVDGIVGVVLAPHHSRGSVGEYAARLSAAAAGHGVTRAETVERWADLPEWVAFQAAAVREAMARLPARTKVLFTAHSLPERVLADDPYPDELRASATAVAAAAGLARWAGWSLAWQSAGRTGEAWRGPDILEVLDDLAGTGRADGVLVCPQGFVAEHLEVLHDLDAVAAARAASLGLAFARTRSIDDDPVVLGALAARVAERAAVLA